MNSHTSIPIGEIWADKPLPAPIYILINEKFILYRKERDVLEDLIIQKLKTQKLYHLFILSVDYKKFQAWTKLAPTPTDSSKINPLIAKSREQSKRAILDIFQSKHPNESISEAIVSSKKLVDDVMKLKYAINSISELQVFSRNIADHSVNVSILSTYLAMQMGYTHHISLQNIGLGGLLHDIGKINIPLSANDDVASIELKRQSHPMLARKILGNRSTGVDESVSNEVLKIIEQHHEHYDGSGFGLGLKGSSIYDLAKIVTIANYYDGYVNNGRGTLEERQARGIELLQTNSSIFDPIKLEKVIRILILGI